MPLFTTLTNERICKEIKAAKKHVILAAPSMSVPVAKALKHANQRLGQGMVQVVLDVSARVTRLGYGEHTAVEILNKGGVTLHPHAGLRIGTLICDDASWSFATSPSLVEADPTADSEAFNAITLTSAQVTVLREELPPVSKNENLPPALKYPMVGRDPVDEGTLNKVKRALEIAPPPQFDLARQTQECAALIRFVELTFE